MNRIVVRLFIVILSVLGQLLANGQDFPMRHYKVEDGLPSNVIYQEYKDSKGYLWIATDKGVARYDGLKFEVFTTSNGLPDNEIFLFFEDSQERLWLGTFNGELCFYKNEIFHTAANTPFLRLPVSVSHTRIIREESDGSVSLKFNGKLINFDNEKATVFRVDALPDREDGGAIFCRKLNSNSYITHTSERKTVYSDTLGNVFQREKIDSITAVYLCNDKYYFLTHSSYLFNERMDTIGKAPPFLKNKFLISYGIYCNDTFYFTTDGLFVNSTTHLLKGISVSSVVADGNGNFWIGTLKDGIYVLPSYYRQSIVHKNVFQGSVEYARALSGKLFYAIGNNVFLFDSTMSQPLFRFEDEKIKSAYLIEPDYSCFKMTTDRLTHVENLFARKPVVRKHKILGSFPKEMVVLNDQLYARTTNVIASFSFEKYNSMAHVELDTQKMWERVYGMATAPDGNLWYSRRNAMYVIKRDTVVELPRFRDRALKQFTFIDDYLVGYTQNNQLMVCTNITGSVQMREVKDHNCIWDRFYRLDRNHLLISTSNKYRLLTIDGEQGHDSVTVSVVEDPFIPPLAEVICTDSSNCYFFKEGSMTSIPIASLFIRQIPPKLRFTSLKLSKGSLHIDSVINLSYAESRNLAIHFSALSFSSKEVFYQYSISRNGVDNWRNLQGEQINLVNIGFGDYTVKVRARTVSSEMGDPIVFQLSIARPFWFSWWFITCSAGGVALLVWLLVRRRTAMVLSKKQKEHDTQVRFMKSEYKALNALMNPHFIFNTLNNVQSLVNSNDKLAANEYLRVFADLIRQNMHNVSKELIPLSKEMELVNNYLMLEKLRFEDKLSYDIFVEDDLHLAEVMVPPLIFQPLVENAIKHGVLQLKARKGHIYIRIFEEGDVVHMQVKDNGVGMSRAQTIKDPAHESFGLENIKKRIEHLSVIQNKRITLQITEEANGIDEFLWTVASISMES